MKKLVLLCGALALLALEVRAQTPEYTAKMTRMLELSGSDAVMKELPKQMIGMMKQQVPAMPDSVSRQIEDLMAEYFPKMLEMMTPIYAKYYTEEDLDGLIAFYESPLGKKMASTQPLILKEVMGVVPQWAAEFGSKMSEIVKSAQIQTQPKSEPVDEKGALVDGNAGYLYFICRTDRIKLCLH